MLGVGAPAPSAKLQGHNMQEKIRDSFIFYRSFFETIGDLDDKQQLEIYRAIAEFSLNDKRVELVGLSKTIFRLIEPQLEANRKRFLNGQKGAEHGKKGGRPKTPRKPQDNPEETPSPTPNKNKNDNLNPKSESKSQIQKKYPEFINDELLDEFVEMRKKLKKPLTERAVKLTLADLQKFEDKQKGFANLALENSIKNSWQGVFEPRNDKQQPQSFVSQINQICGYDLVKDVKESETEIKVICKSPVAKSKLFELETGSKDKIKALFGNKKFEISC